MSRSDRPSGPAWLALGVLLLAPVPVVHHFGSMSIATLRAEDLRIRQSAVEARWLDAVATAIDEPELRWLPLDDPARIAVASSPDGAYLGAPALVAAVAVGERDPLVGLERLSSALIDVDLAVRVVARVRAAWLLDVLGRADRAIALRDQAVAMMDEEAPGLSPSLRRFVTVVRDLSARSASAEGDLAVWIDEVLVRATDVEELVLLSLLAKRYGTAGQRDALLDRRRFPAWRDAVDPWSVDARERTVVATPHGWMVIDPRTRRFARAPSIEAVSATWSDADAGSLRWLEADETPADDAALLVGVRHGAGLTLDLGRRRAALLPSTSTLAGGRDPARLLDVGLAVYAVLVVLLLVAVRRQQARALALSQARDDLIAQVAHELRTPLTVLRMYGESLLGGRVPNEAKRDYLETISHEAERMGQLVDRVVLAARGSPSDDVAAARIDLVEASRASVDGHRALANQRGATLAHEAGTTPVWVRMPDDDLRLVLDVLLDNALRYGGDAPEVRLEVARGDDVATLAVHDRGPGVPASERERIFERWTRGDVGRRASGRGAGMGLFLARRAARAAGGDLRVIDNGGGATFALTLPVDGEGDA